MSDDHDKTEADALRTAYEDRNRGLTADAQDKLFEVQRTQLLLEGVQPPNPRDIGAKERAAIFARDWFSRPESGRDEATLAAMLQWEFQYAKQAAREKAFNDFGRRLLNVVRSG